MQLTFVKKINMIDLFEVAKLIKSGKKKFSKFLMLNLADKYSEGYSHEMIANYLAANFDINISTKDLSFYKRKYLNINQSKTNAQYIKLLGSDLIKNQNFQEIKKIEQPTKLPPYSDIPENMLTDDQSRERMEFLLDPANLPPKRVKF